MAQYKATFTNIVVGAGLMGSAATRYLATLNEGVAVIGPVEPRDKTTHEGVFASHYDQGRLTLLLGNNATWSRIARRSIQQYRWLEEQSGIAFYGAIGRLHADSTPNLDDALRLAAEEQIPHTLYSSDDRSWRERYPYLDFPASYRVLVEPDPAGYINPRSMLHAQLTVAGYQGATVLRETAVAIAEDAAGVTVTTDAGNRYRTDKLLVAAGAFSNFNKLLPRPIPLKLKSETIVLGLVSPEAAARLQGMPVVNYQIDDPEIDDIYMTPPLRYPDGEYYVKLGCNTRADLWFNTLVEVQNWFRSGDSDACLPAMAHALRSIMPTTEFLTIESQRCVVCYTPSGLPTIDALSDRLFVATGGNGSGAKGSDTLGLLAAGLMHDGRWLEEIPRDPFRLATSQP